VITRTAIPLCLVLVSAGTLRAQAPAPPPITVEKLSPNLHCLDTALAGHVTVLRTPEGLLVVDSSTREQAAELASKVKEIAAQPVRYLVNTHYHFDHSGGNAAFGRDVTIVAQQGCRRSMAATLKPGEKPEDAGVPQETFTTERELGLGGQRVKLLNFGNGHTSGDTVVVFEAEKVIAAGDLFFNGFPPYIDVKDGSDTPNWVKTIDTLARRYPDYKVVPGHGAVSDMKTWQRFAAYLAALRQKVASAIQAGDNREQATARVRMDEYPEVRDIPTILTTAQTVGFVYDELKRAK
jgi:cyclase